MARAICLHSVLNGTHDTAADVANAIIEAVGNNVVLGLPVGIGKAVHIADALFQRACSDTSISLQIFTGLTLEKPAGDSALQRRFLGPLVERLYPDWPTPAYASALREHRLPPNVAVREFYLRPGAYLGNPLVQQGYTSINYSQVAAELINLGVNVIAQIVAVRPESPGRVSLSCNPEVTLDLLPRFDELRRDGHAVVMVGQVNRRFPYMLGDADIERQRLDFVLDNDDYDFAPFTLPARRVSAADYAIAMHVASLVTDGGTLQLGIGSLSDAVAHCLKLRHESPDVFAEVLSLLPGGSGSARRTVLAIENQPFDQGLFASTELMSDALYSLFEAGIVKRGADETDNSVIHAGFLIGSTLLYERLHALSETGRRRINMTRISNVNTLFGDEARKRRQRQRARFVNETMMVTLLGAAVSDALEDGRVVSGVGGQFDFVSMAQSLEDARSILMCRAVRVQDGVARSNTRWSYAHHTVPRHHRDVYVSEYGIAATRGLTDQQVIDAMLNIADSAFQPQLIEAARKSGKLAADYRLAADARSNTANAISAIFEHDELRPHFPPYPLGTELTATEQQLAKALQWLDTETARVWPRIRTAAAALLHDKRDDDPAALERMGLAGSAGLRQTIQRRLVAYALAANQCDG